MLANNAPFGGGGLLKDIVRQVTLLPTTEESANVMEAAAVGVPRYEVGVCQPGALYRYTVCGTGSVFVCVFDLARIDTCFSYVVALISKLVDY